MKTDENLVRCKKCFLNNSIETVIIDSKGTCNYCTLHRKLENYYSKRSINDLFKRIKSNSKSSYDCVLGVSGGVDSMFALDLLVSNNIKPLAVLYKDDFINSVAEENVESICKKLNVDLEVFQNNNEETNDLKRAFLFSSTPDIDCVYDLGIASALYSVAYSKNIKMIITGFSFKTEGITPLSQYYFDGKYLKSVNAKYGKIKLSKWSPEEAGFNLEIKHIFFYTIIKGIKTINILDYLEYDKISAAELLEKKLKWKNPGYFHADDDFQLVINYLLKHKFLINKKVIKYSAQIRSGLISKEEGTKLAHSNREISKERVLKMLKKIDISKEQFEEILNKKVKSFKDYSTSYNFIKQLKFPLFILNKLDLLPVGIYEKYFNK